MTIARRLSSQGYTLVELMVTLAVMSIVGMMVFLVLNSGMVLYAKNTAVNSAHQQARTAVDEMLTNIHNSVSIPELTDASLVPIPAPGTGPAAGVSFQSFNAGPFPVVVDAAATDTSITVRAPAYVPPSNVRLNIPSHNIELDVVSSSIQGVNCTFNFAQPIGTAVDIAGNGLETGGNPYVITAFVTTRSNYAVVGTELRYYPTNNLATYNVIARNLITAMPFTIPVLPGGGLQNRYVAAVNLSTVEPSFSQRGYAAVNMFINSSIPFRCRLTNLQ